ncbi:tetratricopeptide repeat protein [Marinobacterium jannaschii]|uniref:tetratricopeptide repeat protein n=1 Tax=Marinobacterium jannaschii TaxID=64970 RepID=UPI00068794C1|nr:tetratricopeptide repeat protein [Marinobacterium jannaschii]
MRILNILRTLTLFIASAALTGNVSGSEERSGEIVLKKGDIVAQQVEGGDWNVVKVLEVDKWPDGTFTAHCLTYNRTSKKPSLDTVTSLDIYAYHAPIDASSFASGWDLIGNSTPKKSELVGFIEYLKLTDFQRYADTTDQDVKQLIAEANRNYKSAIAAGEKGEHKRAISLYSTAIELFPLFYEAIDNRGFTFMDLGQYDKALNDFQQSLQVNPNGLTAYFSAGECLLKLGKYEDAMKVFAAGVDKFPERAELFKDFYSKALALSKNG